MKFLKSTRCRKAAGLFISIFVAALVMQFGVELYFRTITMKHDLREWAGLLNNDLVYTDHWNLTEFRQSDSRINCSYFILDNSGLVIDFQDYDPILNFRADMIGLKDSLQTIKSPITNEKWRLLNKPLQGGRLILGIPDPDDVKNVDVKLVEYAEMFKKTLAKALQVKPKKLKINMWYAIIDNENAIKFIIGGLPLHIKPEIHLVENIVTDVLAQDGNHYGVFTLPYKSSSGHVVGSIHTFKVLPVQPWYRLHYWIVNVLSSAFLAFIGSLYMLPYIGDKFDAHKLLSAALQTGESQSTEFKKSLHWHISEGETPRIGSGKGSKSGEDTVIRAVEGMLNNIDGGCLFIGIEDDKRISGLEQDYEYLMRGKQRSDQTKDRDLFQRHLREVLSNKIQRSIVDLCIETEIINITNKDVCVVRARPAPAPVYIEISLPDGKTQAFFVREGARTDQLNVQQAMAYLEHRWPKTLWMRIRNVFRA